MGGTFVQYMPDFNIYEGLGGDIFDLLERTTPGHGGEIQLTDALQALARRRAMYAYEFQGTRFDAGDKLGYLKAIVAFALRHPELKNEFCKYLKEVTVDL